MDPNGAKHATESPPIHPLVSKRWSPYTFADRPVPAEGLHALFEAARSAPSSSNEQPWRYLVATRDDESAYERMLSCLVEGNRTWAWRAPVLALGVASLTYARNGRPNDAALHDLGQASALLTVEATARGLSVHQMGGILPDRIRELYGVPEDFRPFTALAIGYAGEAGDDVPEKYRERDRTRRPRRPLAETVFAGRWGNPAL
jgi:nitroreductase